jgi:hypothetical protein
MELIETIHIVLDNKNSHDYLTLIGTHINLWSDASNITTSAWWHPDRVFRMLTTHVQAPKPLDY